MSAIEHHTAATDQATSPSAPTTSDAVPRDMRRTWRRLAAVCLILGPLGVTVIRAVMPYWTDDTTAEMVAGMAASPGRAAVMSWLSVVVTPFLFLSALAMGFVARRRAPLIATWGVAVLFGAYSLGSGAGAPDILVEALVKRGDDQASIAADAALLMDAPAMLTGAMTFVRTCLSMTRVPLPPIDCAAWM